MSQQKYRRKKILVDTNFQLGISLKIIVCLACYLVLFCLMAFFSPLMVLLSGSASGAAIESAMSEVGMFVRNLLLPLGLTFTCLALHCILLSHRIAGPAYRFSRTFEAVRDGDLSVDIHLRKGDYLGEVADSYNDMIGSLRADMAEVKGAASEIAARVRSALDGSAGEARPALEALGDDMATLEEMLAHFRLSREEEPEELPADAAEAPEAAGTVS